MIRLESPYTNEKTANALHRTRFPMNALEYNAYTKALGVLAASFPRELYEVKYSPAGDPALASRTSELLQD